MSKSSFKFESAIASWVFVAVWSAAILAEAADWPNWRGPQGNGHWDAPRLAEQWPADGLPVSWTTEIDPAYSGIAIAERRLYTMARRDDHERVVCLKADAGSELWSFEYQADYGDLQYGKGPRATPTLHDGLVYTFGSVGHLHCLDAKSGELKWSKDLVADYGAQQPTWGFAASPVIHGDKVIVHAGAKEGGCYLAFDRQNGKDVWRAGEDPAGYCTPIIIHHGGAEQLIGWTPNHVISLSLADGKPNWQVPYEVTMGVSIATPIFRDSTILVSGYWAGTKAIRLGNQLHQADLVWEENRFLRGLMSQPICRDGFVYLLDKQHGVVCFELASGKIRWTDKNRLTPRGRDPQITMVWVGDSDRAICLNSAGELVLVRFSPEGFSELTRSSIVGETWAHPAYVGNRVYARDDTKVVCVELPTEIPQEE
jgi:hypothetical protein